MRRSLVVAVMAIMPMVGLALEHDAFHFYYRAFGVILILVNAALNAGLG